MPDASGSLTVDLPPYLLALSLAQGVQYAVEVLHLRMTTLLTREELGELAEADYVLECGPGEEERSDDLGFGDGSFFGGHGWSRVGDTRVEGDGIGTTNWKRLYLGKPWILMSRQRVCPHALREGKKLPLSPDERMRIIACESRMNVFELPVRHTHHCFSHTP